MRPVSTLKWNLRSLPCQFNVQMKHLVARGAAGTNPALVQQVSTLKYAAGFNSEVEPPIATLSVQRSNETSCCPGSRWYEAGSCAAGFNFEVCGRFQL